MKLVAATGECVWATDTPRIGSASTRFGMRDHGLDVDANGTYIYTVKYDDDPMVFDDNHTIPNRGLNSDGFLAKYSCADGVGQWVESIGGGGSDYIREVVTTPNGVVIAGATTSQSIKLGDAKGEGAPTYARYGSNSVCETCDPDRNPDAWSLASGYFHNRDTADQRSSGANDYGMYFTLPAAPTAVSSSLTCRQHAGHAGLVGPPWVPKGVHSRVWVIGPHTHRGGGGVLHREGCRSASSKAFIARFFVAYPPQ